MLKLSDEVRDFVRAHPDLQAELADLNKGSVSTIVNHLSRQTEELTKPRYLWTIAKAMGRDHIPFNQLIPELCEEVK